MMVKMHAVCADAIRSVLVHPERRSAKFVFQPRHGGCVVQTDVGLLRIVLPRGRLAGGEKGVAHER